MDYDIILSARKTICIEVDRQQNVLVRVPNAMKHKDICKFVKSRTDWIANAKKQQSLKKPEPTDAELENLRHLAWQYIPDRVNYYSQIMNLYPSAVKITNAKTRFGSCSAKNSICFSCRVMAYPNDAIDYVVVHELAHIAYKNHGDKFYSLVGSILPDYKKRQKLLRG